MAFLGPNDILVTEKTNGTVMRIVNGTMLKEPLLDVNVARSDERGMLGIAVLKRANFLDMYSYTLLSHKQRTVTIYKVRNLLVIFCIDMSGE